MGDLEAEWGSIATFAVTTNPSYRVADNAARKVRTA